MKDEVNRDNKVGELSPRRESSRKIGLQSQISRTIRTIQSTGLGVYAVEISEDRLHFKTEPSKGPEIQGAIARETAVEKWFRDHG